MAEEIKGFQDYFIAFKRRWKLAIATFAAICSVGVGIGLYLPDIYRSAGFILIEQPEVPEEIISSTAQTMATQAVTYLNERILSFSGLVRLIDKYDLYAEERKDKPAELFVSRLRDSILVKVQTRDAVGPSGIPRPVAVGFRVGVEDTVPERAKAVATELTDLYLEETLQIREDETTLANEYVENEMLRLEDEIAAQEAKIAEFKNENASSLPQMNNTNFNSIFRLDDSIAAIDRNLTALEQQRRGIEAQMVMLEPENAPTRLPDGSVVYAPPEQLRILKTQLATYKGRYSDEHPDVIRVKRDIAVLEERIAAEGEAERDLIDELREAYRVANDELRVLQDRYTPDHPDVIAAERNLAELKVQLDAAIEKPSTDPLAINMSTNPAYMQLQATLDRYAIEEQSLRTEKLRLQQKIAEYEQRLEASPAVETAASSLQRDLDILVASYRRMREKLLTTDMSQRLETSGKGTQLVLIEAPRLPLVPVKPDRGAIYALTFLFAIVCSIAITQFMEIFDNSIQSAGAVTSVQGVPPLIEIPYIFSEQELEQSRKIRKIGLIASPAVLVLFAFVVHLLVTPLDVLFYTLLQRLGI